MEIMIERDGHIHTPFCPHGTKDALEAYVKEALKLGRKEITFTEHFPLPKGVTTESFARECSLLDEEVLDYLQSVDDIQKKFQKQIKINKGFEVDYIEGFEKQITKHLNQYGPLIEDSILSVHFLKYKDCYYAIDYLPDFEALLRELDSLEKLYDLYFRTILKSIEANLGVFKPKRIGHPSLIRIFNQRYPLHYDDGGLLEKIVLKLQLLDYEIDLNVAGLRKVDCRESYPTGKLLNLIKIYGIRYIAGSDAHAVNQMALLEEVNNL